MKIRNIIIGTYDKIVRPIFDKDLAVILKLKNKQYPFEAETDEAHLVRSLKWLTLANEKVGGQGFPSKFSIVAKYGLGQPYPEVTGYTLCTLLAILRNKPLAGFDYSMIEKLIKNSCDFLMKIQFPGGAFTGGSKGMANFGQPSIFNTGQIVLGLADVYETITDSQQEILKEINPELIKKSLLRASEFLMGEIDSDGSFKIEHTFLKSKRAYYARAAYGLLRAGIVLKREDFILGSKKFFDYVLTLQEESGWIRNWGFEDKFAVLHTIAYTLRGLSEAYIYFKDEKYGQAVKKGLEFLLSCGKDNFSYPDLLPSHYDKDKNIVNDLCLTGLSQMAIVLKKYDSVVKTKEYEPLFGAIIAATKRFQNRGFKNELLNGLMPASWPINGRYKPYSFIEWGTKFFMDSILLSMGLDSQQIKG